MLQADVDSPLLVSPPPDFYAVSSEHRTGAGGLIKTAMVGLKLSNSLPDLKLSNSSNDITAKPSGSNQTPSQPPASDAKTTQAWIDLRVLRKSNNKTSQTTDTEGNAQQREFLAAGRYNGRCLIGDIVVLFSITSIHVVQLKFHTSLNTLTRQSGRLVLIDRRVYTWSE